MLFPPNDTAGAIFSDCRRYRYRLWRVWDASKPAVAFCMLNPSTADENVLDPTVTRCVGFAKSWGYGRLDVVNLFALRSTDPQALYSHERPISERGYENDYHIEDTFNQYDKLICAWGTHGAFLGRGLKVKENIDTITRVGHIKSKAFHLGLTKEGFPKHPLYLKSDLNPILWE